MRKNPHSCSIEKKELLTIEEAAVVFGIGQIKLREMLHKPDCPFLLMNGRKRMILKGEFLRYLRDVQKI